jgi:hypothetical protein
MRPQPFPEVERIFSTPLIRTSIASRVEVAPISTTRAALPERLKETLISGKACDGANLTGRKGMRAKPANVKQKKIRMIEKDDIFTILENGNVWYLLC